MAPAIRAPGRIDNVILCEDVRQEINRKNTLVGVYSGDILVPSFPAVVRFAIYAEYHIDSDAPHELTFRITYDAAEKIEIVASLQVIETSNKSAVIALPAMNMNLRGPGSFQLDLNYHGGKWKRLLSKSISVGQIPSLGTPPG